jgi:uncharacterized protein with WD repeat
VPTEAPKTKNQRKNERKRAEKTLENQTESGKQLESVTKPPNSDLDAAAKQQRALEKKLRQVDRLVEKQLQGVELTSDELAKIASRPELVSALDKI